MKKSILIALLAVSLALTYSACNSKTQNSSVPGLKTTQKEVYTCSMHPEVRSDKPSNCPKCGMKLVLIDTSDTTHMHNLSDTAHMMK
jgi:membrane fusion protein, copper/silver efflux system